VQESLQLERENEACLQSQFVAEEKLQGEWPKADTIREREENKDVPQYVGVAKEAVPMPMPMDVDDGFDDEFDKGFAMPQSPTRSGSVAEKCNSNVNKNSFTSHLSLLLLVLICF